MVACHFLQRDGMDLGHPSRLPNGSLRSAWTEPGRDPTEFTYTRKWQALFRRRRCASHWSARNLPIDIDRPSHGRSYPGLPVSTRGFMATGVMHS